MEGNKACADCDSPSPKWASANIGILICIKCSGIHRSLGTTISFVRSLDMDKWTDEEVKGMKTRTNAEINEIYEYSVPDSYKKPNEESSMQERDIYIKAKYKDLLFKKDKNKIKKGPVSLPLRSLSLSSSSSSSEGKSIGSGEIITHGILFIVLVEGKNLIKADLLSDSDPFCVFTNGRQTVTSKVVQDSCNPNWRNEQLSLSLENLSRPISLKVWDKDPVGQDFLGGAEINLQSLNLTDDPKDVWIPLDKQGSIHIKLSYQFLM